MGNSQPPLVWFQYLPVWFEYMVGCLVPCTWGAAHGFPKPDINPDNVWSNNWLHEISQPGNQILVEARFVDPLTRFYSVDGCAGAAEGAVGDPAYDDYSIYGDLTVEVRYSYTPRPLLAPIYPLLLE
ncbi:MAG: hypothetical protein GY850_36225 [bacterium]|nr:hypothetical protein [bacterium]